MPYRFNWDSPILISPHDSKTIYYGGNFVFKSVNRGDKWELISPDVTRGKPGPSDDRGHTITTLAESPLKAGVLWVGTDDGRVLVTRNGGAESARGDHPPAGIADRALHQPRRMFAVRRGHGLRGGGSAPL